MHARTLVVIIVLTSAAHSQNTDLDEPEATPSLDTVFERLSSTRVLRGDFVQERVVPGLSAPLESRGRFLLADRGLYWEQTQPFRSVLIATEDRILQTIRDREPTIVAASDAPAAASVASVFLSTFRGDQAALEKNFDMTFDHEGPIWVIELVPVEYPLTEAVALLALRGRSFIEELRLTGVADDVLTVEFRNLSDEPSDLRPDEIALFSP